MDVNEKLGTQLVLWRSSVLKGFCSRHGLLLKLCHCSSTCYCVTHGCVENCTLLQVNDTAVIYSGMYEHISEKQTFIIILCGFINIPTGKRCSIYWAKTLPSQNFHITEITLNTWMQLLINIHISLKYNWVGLVIYLVFYVLYADYIRLVIHADIKVWGNNLHIVTEELG
jgi:hypothetical protein